MKIRFKCFILLILTAFGLLLVESRAVEETEYLEAIKPVLQKRCYACHGALKQKKDLRLDTARQIIDAGIIESGELLARLTASDPDERMPPEGEPLHLEEIEAIRTWIAGGAPAPAHELPEDDPAAHWAFQRIERPARPAAGIVGNPIDAFLAAKHAELGLKSQPEAERSLLIRRLYLDLIGLPPTGEEVDAFVSEYGAARAADDETAKRRNGETATPADTIAGSPAPRLAESKSRHPATERVFEELVTRLLDSPAYGERWGRHWMDIWRYSDWYGLGVQLRNSQKHLWHWRDWIVDSLNADKGYDRMILEMIAGDELEPENPEVLAGTGFLARNYYLFNRTTWLDDTIEHTSKAFLGLTMNCAKCHNHKYDPIDQTDYYRFRAIFEPHQVRLDAIAGETDFEKDGLPRVFDDHPEEKTFLHIRGNPATPDTDTEIEPGVPAILAGFAKAPEPIELPAFAWAPGTRSYVQKDQLAAARTKLERAREALAKAKKAAVSQEPPELSPEDTENSGSSLKDDSESSDPGAALKLAEARLEEAEIGLRSLQARIAADDAILLGRGDGDPATSARLEREHAVALARIGVLTAEAGKLEAAEKALKSAEKDLKKTDADYAPVRGSFKSPETPEHKEPQYAATYPKTSTGRRLALAHWMTSRENPLTARVAVNHIWLRHFGTPLVETVFDFGRRAPRPEHAELLDYLAVELIESGWSMKHLHKMIVTSKAWRRSSSNLGADPETWAADPDNHFYWRMNSRRMESQVIQDSLLHLAGALDLKQGGPPVDPVPEARRRSLYFRHSREGQGQLLSMFDDADIFACYRRSESIVPQQALALSNSKISIEMSEQLASLFKAEADDGEFAARVFEIILCRVPTALELEACTTFLVQLQEVSPEGPGRTRLVQALFNHNDFINIR